MQKRTKYKQLFICKMHSPLNVHVTVDTKTHKNGEKKIEIRS